MTPEQAQAIAALVCRIIDYHHAIGYTDVEVRKDAEQGIAEAIVKVGELGAVPK